MSKFKVKQNETAVIENLKIGDLIFLHKPGQESMTCLIGYGCLIDLKDPRKTWTTHSVAKVKNVFELIDVIAKDGEFEVKKLTVGSEVTLTQE